jgi:spore germination protein YaaH
MTKTAIKTKKAPIHWNNENKVTCYYYGDKDEWGKAIWYDENGKAYELIYARLANKYSFNPYGNYDKQ